MIYFFVFYNLVCGLALSQNDDSGFWPVYVFNFLLGWLIVPSRILARLI